MANVHRAAEEPVKTNSRRRADLTETVTMSGILAALSFRDFWSEEQIRRFIAELPNKLYDHPTSQRVPTGADSLRTLLIFSNSKQHTWLVAGNDLVACVLDDLRREDPRLQWIMKPDEIEPLRAKDDYSADSGVLYFGYRNKGWLYSKKLFQGGSVLDAVRRFLTGNRH